MAVTARRVLQYSNLMTGAVGLGPYIALCACCSWFHLFPVCRVGDSKGVGHFEAKFYVEGLHFALMNR